MDFADALLMVKAGHPELAGWWGKLLGGGGKTWDEMTWDDVIAATKNGKYKSFEIGAMKELDLGTEGIVHMQIVGIDADDLADGSGKAPMSFVVKKLLVTKHKVNPVLAPASPPYNVGTGMVGGWKNSDVRAYLNDVIWPLIPQNVRSAIRTVVKYSTSYDTAGQKVNDAVTYDKLWIPSSREIHGAEGIETRGPVYSDVFSGLESRLKYRQEGGNAATWWLRTGYDKEKAYYTTQNGYLWQWKTNDNDNIAIGFCL